MKIKERNPLILSTLGILLLSSPSPAHAAKKVKISHSEWRKVVTPHINETYLVAEGETLQSISKKLFGKEKYWSKLLEINQSSISNPDQLQPGTILVFFQTQSENTQKSKTQSNAKRTARIAKDPLDDDTKPRSTEWKNLPKQAWESDVITELSHIDKNNFDIRSKTNIRRLTSYDPHFIPASEKLSSLGRIIGSQNSANYFMLTDLVFIKASENMKIGDTYAITQDPVWISNGVLSAGGYAYYILGKVKIIGVQENTFIGTIVAQKHLIGRNHFLIPVPPRIPEMKPIPGPRPLKALALLNRQYTASFTTQNREVFISRGTEDGVQPGMIFRAYFNSDPSNDGSLPSSEFIINGDILVTQVSESFSTGLVLYSRNMINHASRIVLLTDVSDVGKHVGFSQKGGDGLDEIDLLDSRDTPDNREAQEIKQLENWRGNPVPLQDQKKMQEISERTADIGDLPDPRALRSPVPNPDPLPYLKEKTKSPALKSTVPDNKSPEMQIMREQLNTQDSDQSSGITPHSSSSPDNQDQEEDQTHTQGASPAPPPATLQNATAQGEQNLTSTPQSSSPPAPTPSPEPLESAEPVAPAPPPAVNSETQSDATQDTNSREINSLKPKQKKSSVTPGEQPPVVLPMAELAPAPSLEPSVDDAAVQPPTLQPPTLPTLPSLPAVSSTQETTPTNSPPQNKP